MFGGTMRQTGILAGAAIYAIDNHLERLQIDHAHAKQLAQGLNSIDGVVCDTNNTDTNLLFFDIDKRLGDGPSLCRKLSENGVLAEALDMQRIRFVTHLNVSPEEIDRAIQITTDTCNHASN